MPVSNILTIFKGMFGEHNSPASAVAPPVAVADWTQFGRKYVAIAIPADAAAATASEPMLFTATPNYASGILIYNVWILPHAALTANGSNFATYQLGTRPQAGGGSQTTVGTALTTAAVSWVAVSQISLFASTAGQAVAQNINVTIAITKSGTGVVTPQSTLLMEFAEA